MPDFYEMAQKEDAKAKALHPLFNILHNIKGIYVKILIF